MKIGPFCMETVALPAEKRNAGGFGGGGGEGGVGGILVFFGGVVRKCLSNVTKIFLFLWKKIFRANFIGNAHPTTLFLGKTSDSLLLLICICIAT